MSNNHYFLMVLSVGLAVKASQQKCRDPLFSFLLNIDSYQLCCSDDGFSNTPSEPDSEKSNKLDFNIDNEEPEEDIVESRENVDGTIILTGDGEYLWNNKCLIYDMQVFLYVSNR